MFSDCLSVTSKHKLKTLPFCISSMASSSVKEIREKTPDMVRLLTASGLDPLALDKNQCNAFHHAAFYGSLGSIRVMYEDLAIAKKKRVSEGDEEEIDETPLLRARALAQPGTRNFFFSFFVLFLLCFLFLVLC